MKAKKIGNGDKGDKEGVEFGWELDKDKLYIFTYFSDGHTNLDYRVVALILINFTDQRTLH